MTKTWFRNSWPYLFGSTVAAVVGLPAAVSSYRHGMTVIERSSDPGMAAWLPMTTDGLLVASLVALWVRRLTGRKTGLWHWAAFGLGLVATILTNLAGARGYIDHALDGWGVIEAIGWAVWPPVCLAVVLEIIAWLLVPDAVETGQTDTETGPTDGQTDAGPAVNQQKLSDEEILPALHEWVELDGEVPSRKAVIDRFGVGATRADRLRGLVMPGPRLVKTDETDGAQHRREA